MKAFIAILQYLPYLLTAVPSVEAALPTGTGATKKAIIMAGIDAAAKAGETVPEAHVAAISSFIDGLVGLLNKTSLLGFGKAAAPVAPVA